jgi:aspartyl-tRNA(Asn)/glutamyl-tRNA(Gln) amidotransferase subunit A
MLPRRHFNLASLLSTLLAEHSNAANSPDLVDMDILTISSLLRSRALSVPELVDAYLQRISRFEPELNTFITITEDLAMKQAQQLQLELDRGYWRGPLHGIPIGLKDNIDTRGIPTTAASELLSHRIPTTDATAWQHLQASGTVLMGKCNMHEFAYGGSSAVSHVGAVRNPWNIQHIPGGSSGGSAAAVAAQLVMCSIGTDTLASIRLPASYCGITGLKPTHGLTSLRGIIPVAESLDHLGPLARSAADCAFLLSAIAKYDPKDAMSIDAGNPNYNISLFDSVHTLRLGVPENPYWDDLHPDVERATLEALSVLESMTVSSQRLNLPQESSFIPLLVEGYAWHQHLLENPTNHSSYDNSTLERLIAAGATPAAEYKRAKEAQTLSRRAIAEVFQQVDIIVTPTAPSLPEPITEAAIAQANSAEPSVRNTAPFNVYGIPTISIPCGFSTTGLPIGLQLSSAYLTEATLLAIAHAYQQQTDWHLKAPLSM